MKRIVLSTILIVSLAALRQANEPFTTPVGWPQPIYDFSKNNLTEERIGLGRKLFYDPILSDDGTISCASCHSPFSAFAHNDHALSHGIHDSIGTRNAPALFNLAWRSSFMWDGAINNLDVQALAPIHHPGEMGSDIKSVTARLSASSEYRELFKVAYGDSLINTQRILKAISQFLVTLVSADSKYDSVMAGVSCFNEQELNGYELFKANCNSCHAEPLFMSNEFSANGITSDASTDHGRYRITGTPNDSDRFQIPSLRNLSYTYPYMHDGRFKRLQDVINHYSDGKYRESASDPRLRSIAVLDGKEKIDLLAFLLTLNDRQFLFNPAHQDPHAYSLRNQQQSKTIR